MQRETQQCPRCGSVLDYRLGQYECPGCGHTQLEATPARSAAGLPPGPAQAADFNTPVGYSPPPVEDFADPRRAEKFAHIWAQGAGYAVLLLVLASDANVAGYEVMNERGRGWALGVMMLIAPLAVGTIWLSLFARERWLKWLCAGCAGCMTLRIASNAMIAVLAESLYNQRGLAFLSFLQLGLCLWFLSLVWRDIKDARKRR